MERDRPGRSEARRPECGRDGRRKSTDYNARFPPTALCEAATMSRIIRPSDIASAHDPARATPAIQAAIDQAAAIGGGLLDGGLDGGRGLGRVVG